MCEKIIECDEIIECEKILENCEDCEKQSENSSEYCKLLCKCYCYYEKELKSDNPNHSSLKSVKNTLKKNHKFKCNDNCIDKLIKQLAYDCLVIKRRKYIKITPSTPTDIYEQLDPNYENPANFPTTQNANGKTAKDYDIKEHINGWTKWNEDWECIECCGVKFRYLKNLDASLMILGKDWMGKLTYKKLFDNKKLEDMVKVGFDKKIPTNINLCKLLRNNSTNNKNYKIGKYDTTKEIVQEDANKNVFLINTFVFLSAGNTGKSQVSEQMFIMSVNNFIRPLLEIINPITLLTLGKDAYEYIIGFREFTWQKVFYKKTTIPNYNLQDINIIPIHHSGNLGNINFKKILNNNISLQRNTVNNKAEIYDIKLDL